MRLESVFRALFVVYCVEAGLFLVVFPWTPAWDRLSLALPLDPARSLLGLAWLRGFVTGFGLVHVLWAIHDLDLFLRRAPGTAAGPVGSVGPAR